MEIFLILYDVLLLLSARSSCYLPVWLSTVILLLMFQSTSHPRVNQEGISVLRVLSLLMSGFSIKPAEWESSNLEDFGGKARAIKQKYLNPGLLMNKRELK